MRRTPREQYLQTLGVFVQRVWGSPQALQSHLPQEPHVHLLDFGEFYQAFRFYFGDNLLKPETDTGQPGIGKTYFLLYALVEFLRQQQAVALPFLNGQPYYLLFQGPGVTCHDVTNQDPLFEPDFVWVLFDSNNILKSPSGVFQSLPERIRVIQATSPKRGNYYHFSKQFGSRPYIMDIWSTEEIRHLALLLDLEVERMITLARRWGGVPRILVDHFSMSDWEINERYSMNAQQAIKFATDFTHAGANPNFNDGASLPFYFVRPRVDPEGHTLRTLHTVSVPAPTLHKLLGDGLKAHDNAMKLRFYSALSHSADTRQSLGHFFESWFHSFFLAKKTLACQWVQQNVAGLPTTLKGTDVFIPRTQNAPHSVTPPFYWAAPINFPGIDGAFVSPTGIFAFQIVIASEHRRPEAGLTILWKNLQSAVRSVPWRIMFIGPDPAQIEPIARTCARIPVLQSGTNVQVGWSVVDPVQNDVKFWACEIADSVDDLTSGCLLGRRH